MNQDGKSLAAVSIVSVLAVVIVGGFVSDAQTNNLDYQSEVDFNSGLFSSTEVVNDDVVLAGENTTGTWNTGLLANDVLTSSEVNVSIPDGTSGATLTVNYYNDSADNVSDGTVQNSESFTLSDGSNDLTIDHDDSYDQVAYEVELDRDSGTDTSPALETFTAMGEKTGLEWTVLGFLAAILGVAALLKILGKV